MVTRRSLQDEIKDSNRLPSGLEGQNIPDDFNIPSCGIEDVDKAVFNLFDKDINFLVEHDGNVEKVPVIFATGERFALIKKQQPLRDKSGRIILPLISVRRTGIDQSNEAITPGPRADLGDMVIKRRLSKDDPKYQALINKIHLKNQENVATSDNAIETGPNKKSKPGTISTRRPGAQSSQDTYPGNLLESNLDRNIYEMITIPYPHFFTMSYEVTFWTQYTAHMNQVLETLMNSYSPTGGGANEFKLTSDKGYYFVAFVDASLSSGDNFDDYSDDERIVKYTITMKVTSYLVATRNPGDMNPFRYFVSAPDVSFEMFESAGKITAGKKKKAPQSGDLGKFVLTDVDDIAENGDLDESDREIPYYVEATVEDPFSGKHNKQQLKVLTRNQRSGETFVSARIIKKIGDI